MEKMVSSKLIDLERQREAFITIVLFYLRVNPIKNCLQKRLDYYFENKFNIDYVITIHGHGVQN